MSPGAFEAIYKIFASFCKEPGFSQNVTPEYLHQRFVVYIRLVGCCFESNLSFGTNPMTSSLQLTSQQSSTKSIGNSCLTMMPNDDLNAFYEGLVDEDGFLGADVDDCIDENGAVDDDALEEHIAHLGAAYVRKRNLLLSLMQIVEQEVVEEAEADAVAFHSFREQFRFRHRKKRRKAKRQWYCDPITGKMRRVCPHLSSWWLDYVQNPEPDCPTWNKVFRQRF